MSEEIYIEANVPVFEAIYGKGLISLGGYVAVDAMFAGIPLQDKKLLDIGSGIGGMAYYLVQKYNCFVTGLEVYPWMAEYALRHAPKKILDKINFITYDSAGFIPLESNSLDIVYSKGVLTNVKDKATLFNDIFRVLRPGGKIVFVDWLVPESDGPNHEQLAMGDMSFKETPSAYTKLLEEAGFSHIVIEDRNQEYLKYVKTLDRMYRSNEHIDKFSDIISSKLREELIHSNCQLKDRIQAGKQISMHIQAIKND